MLCIPLGHYLVFSSKCDQLSLTDYSFKASMVNNITFKSLPNLGLFYVKVKV